MNARGLRRVERLVVWKRRFLIGINKDIQMEFYYGKIYTRPRCNE